MYFIHLNNYRNLNGLSCALLTKEGKSEVEMKPFKVQNSTSKFCILIGSALYGTQLSFLKSVQNMSKRYKENVV